MSLYNLQRWTLNYFVFFALLLLVGCVPAPPTPSPPAPRPTH